MSISRSSFCSQVLVGLTVSPARKCSTVRGDVPQWHPEDSQGTQRPYHRPIHSLCTAIHCEDSHPVDTFALHEHPRQTERLTCWPRICWGWGGGWLPQEEQHVSYDEAKTTVKGKSRGEEDGCNSAQSQRQWVRTKASPFSVYAVVYIINRHCVPSTNRLISLPVCIQ